MQSLNSELFSYLNQLKKNNNREWFEQNKTQFKSLSQDFKEWTNLLRDSMSTFDQIDQAKVFRIYRDVRFSKDKTPYKTHFSVNLTRQGKDRRGSYYLHLEPGQSFVASGFYGPESHDLYRIRKEFEQDDQTIRQILKSPEIVSLYKGELKGDELKTAPRDFDRNDPALDLIRKKQYYFSRPLEDKQIFTSSFLDEVTNNFEATMPFLNYMSDVLTTNLNGEPIED